jgi:UDP-3-O-[3-hydroxymyristoyl] glucosamine N-acyltransferase
MMKTETYRPTAMRLPTPGEVAEWTGGELRDVADPEARLTGLATLEKADEGEIAFVATLKAAGQAADSQAGLLIVSPATDAPGRPRVVVEQVWAAVAAVMQRLYPEPEPDGRVHPTAAIGVNVELGAGVSIGPYCVIGDDCKIGDGTVLGPHCIVDAGCAIGWDCRLTARVTLRGTVLIGDRVTIHPGAVLGADGFKFESVDGRALKIPQVGAVVIEDDVEIGANTTIDRAFLYETRIGRGTKIDNLVQIAHNVQIGPGCLIAAQVGIAGSTRLGAGCLLGGNAGLADNLVLGNRVTIGAAAKVHGNHPDGATLMGYPAIDMKAFARVAAALPRLPELFKRMRALEKKAGIAEKSDDASANG